MPETGDYPIKRDSDRNGRIVPNEPFETTALQRRVFSISYSCNADPACHGSGALRFVAASDAQQSGIGPIFVINLDRQPNRWTDMVRELDCILDAAGKPLSERVVRYSACDAQVDPPELLDGADVDPYYTLGDQLFVEPQPHAIPDAFDLERPIRMSQAEIAVARSHIGVWKAIAQSNASYTLVLEDDVWFERGFGRDP